MHTLQQRFDRFAYYYDLVEFLPEKLLLAKNREKIIGRLRGKILEIGVGTGKNLLYYNKEAQVIATDFSPRMLAHAAARLKKLGRTNIILQQEDAECLSFADNTFDVVVATCVFCSIADPVKGLSEIRRVLKEEGEAILLEHVQSENSFRKKLQDIFNPLTKLCFCCNLNRKTRENIEAGGLKIVEDQRAAAGDVVRVFRCEK
jgi:ubiquinone/menaquinone biosynthesis C-methylase UbiE